jgi:hypothetical protein
MKVIRPTVLLALATFGIDAVAGPVGVVVNVYTSFGSGVNGSAEIPMQQFDPSLGTLTDVDIDIATSSFFSDGGTLFNHGSSPASFSFQETASETIDVAGNIGQTGYNAGISGTIPATPFNGLNCSAASGPPIECQPLVNGLLQSPSFLPSCGVAPDGTNCILSCPQLNLTCSQSPTGVSLLALGPLAPFIGTGTVDVPATFSYSQTLTSPDGVTNIIGGPVILTTVDYFYTPADASTAPEPSTWGLLLAGACAIAIGKMRTPR